MSGAPRGRRQSVTHRLLGGIGDSLTGAVPMSPLPLLSGRCLVAWFPPCLCEENTGQ